MIFCIGGSSKLAAILVLVDHFDSPFLIPLAQWFLTLDYCIRVYFTPSHFKKSSLSGPWQQVINHLYSFSLMIDLVEGGCISVISRY